MTATPTTPTRVQSRILLAESGRYRDGGEAFDGPTVPRRRSWLAQVAAELEARALLAEGRLEAIRVDGETARELQATVVASERQRLDPARDAAELEAASVSDAKHLAAARKIYRAQLVADVREAVRYAGARSKVAITVRRARRPRVGRGVLLFGKGSPMSVSEGCWSHGSQTITAPFAVDDLRTWLAAQPGGVS
jgi:hypothetical protein